MAHRRGLKEQKLLGLYFELHEQLRHQLRRPVVTTEPDFHVHVRGLFAEQDL